MDTFEEARRIAAQVHEEIAATGVDAWKPFALVQAAAERRGISMSEVPPETSVLRGGQAVFDAQLGLIALSTAVPHELRALVAAHELGHAVIEGAGGCNGDIDTSQSLERAPVGLQRVEDYGPRARSELRANVFAREFVLPRMRARRLHVEEGMTSTDIAQRAGIDLATVRQQILDATLLPPEPSAAIPTTFTPRPNPAQERAASHSTSALLLEAGPGTGKTKALVDRVSCLLRQGAQPSALLVLTFSNRAAKELVERISRACPQEAPLIWVGTFHAFGLDLIRRFHDKVGRSANPRLFDRSDAVEMLEETFPTLPLRHLLNLWDPTFSLRSILDGISRAKDELLDHHDYRKAAQESLEAATTERECIAAEKCLEVASVYELYEMELRENDGLDFGDLIRVPVRLLQSDPAVRGMLQEQYQHVLVDEYQDVNRASALLLRELVAEPKRLWVVGDPRQSVYRFRGASAENMDRFDEDFVGAQRDSLKINFRSTPEIIDLFSAFANGGMRVDSRVSLSADRESGKYDPSLAVYETELYEAHGIADEIRSLEQAGIALRDQAVLCRSNRRMADIARVLEARGIPLLHLGSIFERPEIRFLLSLLSLFSDHFGDALIRVGVEYGLTLQDSHLLSQRIQNDEQERSCSQLLTELALTQSLSPEGRNGIARLVSELAGIGRNDSAWSALTTYLLDNTRRVAELAGASTVAKQMEAIAIWQLLNFARDPGPPRQGQPIRRMLERVRQLVGFAEDRELRHVPQAALHLNGVRLMTVHGSKGLEFEAVHVPSLGTALFPTSAPGPICPLPQTIQSSDSAKQSRDDEEESLFFVALSRARSVLRLSRFSTQRNGNRRGASKFLSGLGPRVDEFQATTVARAPDTEFAPIKLTALPRLTSTMVADYERCPRRFFYTHAFGLRGARRQTAFSRTHTVVHSFLKWLQEARVATSFTADDARTYFAALWNEGGPTKHALADHYLTIAKGLVDFALNSTEGITVRMPESLPITTAGSTVWVENAFVGEDDEGPVLHQLRSGRRRSDEFGALEYALQHLAGTQRFPRQRYKVISVLLSNRETHDVPKPADQTRRVRDFVDAVKSGAFPADPNPKQCPRCPHFHLCGQVGPGALKKD